MAMRSWWGWGNRDDAVTGREREALAKRVAALLPTADLTVHDAPDPTSLDVPAPRDHRPWYDRQRPEPFAAALRAAKSALDPAGILNPGVLIDPAPRLPAPEAR
jgi:FAD/FMN-containing dehydrogenase